jgi:hypothetical protein
VLSWGIELRNTPNEISGKKPCLLRQRLQSREEFGLFTNLLRFCPILLILATAASLEAASVPTAPLLEQGYRQMYNLEFNEAHKTFGTWQAQHPNDPLGHASNAAAYLFAEFDRLKILQSEFFVHDTSFRKMKKLNADPAVRQAFNNEIDRALQLSDQILATAPNSADALFAKILATGLRADYEALIDKHYLDSLSGAKSSRTLAEKLLSIEPSYYDAYLAIGVENYLLSLKPLALRWVLQMGGAQTDRERGIENLRKTAEKGHYLSPYARLLLGVAALRAKDRTQARDILTGLSREFPHNQLYAEELARLQ